MDVQQFATVRVVRRVSAVAVVVGLLGTAACGGGGHPKAVATTTTTPTTVASTTTTVDTTKAAILAAYRAHWDDVAAVDSAFPVHPLDPRLASHAVGKQLTSEQQALTHLSLLGHYNQGATDLSPVVTLMNGATATVVDCIFDHSVEVDSRTKLPIGPPDVGHTSDQFTLTMVNGAWYVSDSTVQASGKARDACVPSPT